MSLIKCGECNKEISDQATACPSCGNPIHHQEETKVEKTVEIELTSKKWKKKRLWGLLFLAIGVMMLPTKLAALGIILIIVAIVIAFIANIGAWWTNG